VSRSESGPHHAGLGQLDLHDGDEAFEFSHPEKALCHSEESVDWLANRLECLSPEMGHAATNEVLHLVDSFCKAPVPLICPHMERFLVTLTTEELTELDALCEALGQGGRFRQRFSTNGWMPHKIYNPSPQTWRNSGLARQS
jgi:hypothetical protein